MAKRVMFYVQHLLGIGHLARASLICKQLIASGFDVRMVMGGAPVNGIPDPEIHVVQLPILKAGCVRFNELTDANGNVVDKHYLDNRRDQLLCEFDSFKPDMLIIEAFPFGRRAMRFELLPLLERAKIASWNPKIAGSVRDILQEKKRPDRVLQTVTTLNSYFDLLLAHGDRSFATLNESFQLADDIEIPVYYTGIVSAPVPALQGERFDVIVSAGGGAAGMIVMEAALKACSLSVMANASWCFLTGQNLPKDDQNRLSQNLPGNITIETHRNDFRAMLAHAKLSISQAGYNTTADILRAKCPSILIPFAQEQETEQTKRALKLSEKGLATIVSEANISPQTLADAIDATVASSKADASVNLDMAGAENTADILHEILAKH